MNTSRRKFITKSVLATAGISAGFSSLLNASNSPQRMSEFSSVPRDKSPEAFKISVFSKHLQWLDYIEMAKVSAEIGFDGVDLTVRPQGHVLPENVERDLPLAMEAVSKTGKNIFTLATAITDASDPLSVKILKTANSLGIKHYRMGWRYYDEKKTVKENLNDFQTGLCKLAELNEKYSISGEYQNHSGVDKAGIYFGGAIWDLSGILQHINSPWLGSQYDIYHANVEGTNGWPVGLKLISPFIKSIDIKDYQWAKLEGKWTSQSVPLGEGIVDFQKYFSFLKQHGISGPISIHYEYPLGGAEHGGTTITMKREDVIAAMRKDLVTLKKYMEDAQLS